jgi:hypothetical protein
MKFAILTPTRQRPAGMDRLIRSVNETMSNQNEISMFIGIDKDDPDKRYYYDMIHGWQLSKKENMTIILIEDVRRTTAKIWNDLVRIRSWENSPDYFIMGNDDVVYKTTDWDVILAEKIKNQDHPFYLYWFNDNINGEKHCAFPIVSKYWIGATGYFVPELFRYFYSDTWTYDIAKKAGVCVYIPDVVAEHLHFSLGSHVKFDETYKFNRQGGASEEDSRTFSETEPMRENISKEIRRRIEVWNKENITK